jgi:hypothetical protein
MRRLVIAIVLAVLVVASVGSLAAATHHIPTDVPGDDGRVVAATGDTDATGTPTPTVAPGARFAGAIGAHREHHANEMSEETVEVRLSQSGSELARAEVVADVYDAKRDRLDELAERGRELRRARDNGTISESEYRARRAVLDADLRSIERVATRIGVAAEGLSPGVLLEVNVALVSIQELETGARDRQSGELGRIAPSFASDGGNATDTGATTTPEGGRDG